jgi:hypothetical protein
VAKLDEDLADERLDWCEETIPETGKSRLVRLLRQYISAPAS